MEYKFDDFPGRTLHILLFEQVANSKFLLELLQSAKLVPEVALMNAALIPDGFPLLAAAHSALLTQSRGQLRSKTLHSELVLNYAGSKHITESFRRIGVGNDTAYLLLARFDATPDEMHAARALVDGTEVALTELEARADRDLIQKTFKLTAQELQVSSLADAIVFRQAVSAC
ncbi:hypothetical protein KFL_003780110 [Klebsormidium nitens]|uniref:Uncharacterized protein n=1 Tax=Klebsormidium nitens TaxID=105231 RepID=A0A1Y1IA11_KLENI|nr:hypothetical protein KFL_003780110 [Klebsormidium nitens]|eukprot:GAQ87805.1 hypothetical protein KFL_003780110 [Klebsormidium nitens]